MSAADKAEELLKAGLARIEKGWCQGEFAVDAEGVATGDSRDPRACRFCVVGALLAGCDLDDPAWSGPFDIARCALVNALPFEWHNDARPEYAVSLSEYNDAPTTAQADVVDLYKRALASRGGIAVATGWEETQAGQPVQGLRLKCEVCGETDSEVWRWELTTRDATKPDSKPVALCPFDSHYKCLAEARRIIRETMKRSDL